MTSSSHPHSIMTIPVVRPPLLAPTAESTSDLSMRIPMVILHHPGYGADDILLTLPAVDSTPTAPAGLSQRIVLTAGAIIADNVFDRVYLTRDRAGRERVDATLPDGLLQPGDYWLQVEGYRYQPPQDAQEDTRPVASSMPPPPPRPVATSSDTTPQTQSPHHLPYPIVPCFADWRFPHDRVPAEWKKCHLAPQPSATPPSPHISPTQFRHCWITGYHMGINECHVVPKNQDAWWAANSMRKYAINMNGASRDIANIAWLRADIHQIFDGHKFAIIPKPSSPLPGSSGSAAFAFAAHVLESDHEAREFCSLYHNVAIAQAGIDRLSPEFLFARFAWAIFAHLQTFVNSSITRRHLAVLVWDGTDRHTELIQMDGEGWTRYLAARGQTHSGSRTRKRSSSQITQEADDGVETDDAYQERWSRRSSLLDSADSEEDLDPEMRQIRRNTRWYEEVGRFSQGDLEQEQLERNTRWYEEVGRLALAGLSDGEEPTEAGGWDHDSDPGCGRRPRGRRHHLGSSPPSLHGMPQLSSSFTTHGSNRSSSSLADLSGCEDNKADEDIHIGSAVPGAKVLVDGPIPDQDASVERHVLPP